MSDEKTPSSWERALDADLRALAEQENEPDTLAVQLGKRRTMRRLFEDTSRPAAEPVPDLRIGRYTLLQTLGAGSMGVVYAAYDEELDRKIALKLMRNSDDERAGQRMRREAQALARLSHPNVVQIYEVGEHEGELFLAMELIAGQTLGDWLAASEGPRPWREALDILIPTGRGLEAAHDAGLVHRDFKPANVLVGADGRPRVLDFGLVHGHRDSTSTHPDQTDDGRGPDAARETTASKTSKRQPERGNSALTQTGTLLGTPAYMAPEQRAGLPVDARADQFAFCVVLFEALYGSRQSDESRRDYAAARGGVPRAVSAAVLRGLSPEPDARWPNLGALLDALDAARWRRRRRLVAVGLIAAALGGGGIASAGGWVLGASTPAVCAIDGDMLAGTWDADRRAALRDNAHDDGAPFAEATLQTVEKTLDDTATRWLAAQREACKDTHVWQVQSAETLDQRTACLARKRAEIDAVVEALTDADAKTLARADDVLRRLPDLGECSNLRTLGDRPAWPRDPALVARTEAAFSRLARLRVAMHAGRLDTRSLTEAFAALETEAAVLGDTPLQLELEAARAEDLLLRGTLDAGLDGLKAAALSAGREGLRELEADLRTSFALWATAAHGSVDAAGQRWAAEEARVALARVGRTRDPRAPSVEFARASAQAQGGDRRGAAELHTRAVELARERLEADDLVVYLDRRANALRSVGKLEQAHATLQELEDVLRARWGANHPRLGIHAFNVGALAVDQGRFDAALKAFAQARAVFVKAWGPRSVHVARTDLAVARARISQGQFDAAATLLDQALPLLEDELGADALETAEAYNTQATVAFYRGDLEHAEQSYRRALIGYEQQLGVDHDGTATARANLGETLLARGKTDQAQAELEAALVVLEQRLGPMHPYLGVPLKARGLARRASGALKAARDDLERALDLLEVHDDEPYETAATRLALAETLVALGNVADARALASAAAEAFTKLGDTERAADARALAQEHDQPTRKPSPP